MPIQSSVLPDMTDPSIDDLLAARPHLRMDAFEGLMLEGVALGAIADSLGTPVWVTGAATLRTRYRRLAGSLREAGIAAQIHYAVKANDHLAVLRVLSLEGAGADVVSGGELGRAVQAGIPADRIVFSGVGKTADELSQALSLEVGQINVESAEELTLLSALAAHQGRIARIALRVNPDVDARTHAKISTGRAGDKFGVAYDEAAGLYARAGTLPGIAPLGFAVHIGSQISQPAPFRVAFARIATLVETVRAAGQDVSVVDCGGGLGIAYRDEIEGSPRALANAIRVTLGGRGLRLAIEPGRWLTAPAGVLLSTVVRVKRERDTPPFVVLDSAMNDLLRPSLYEAWHGVVPISAWDVVRPTAPVHLVGPVCETGDTLARDRHLPLLSEGARVAILDTGAYGSVMSSTYNARPLAAQALVDGDRWTVIRQRQPVERLWEGEIVPNWLGEGRAGME
jgi:diaminopimelate decarboxylase